MTDDTIMGVESALPSPLTGVVVRRPERAFDVSYDIGGACGRLTVYATNWLSAIEQATCDIADEQHMLTAQISVRPMP